MSTLLGLINSNLSEKICEKNVLSALDTKDSAELERELAQRDKQDRSVLDIAITCRFFSFTLIKRIVEASSNLDLYDYDGTRAIDLCVKTYASKDKHRVLHLLIRNGSKTCICNGCWMQSGIRYCAPADMLDVLRFPYGRDHLPISCFRALFSVDYENAKCLSDKTLDFCRLTSFFSTFLESTFVLDIIIEPRF